MSAHDQKPSNPLSIMARYRKARALVDRDVPVRVACRKAEIGKTKYYELYNAEKELKALSQEAPGTELHGSFTTSLSSPQDDRQRLGSKNENQQFTGGAA